MSDASRSILFRATLAGLILVQPLTGTAQGNFREDASSAWAANVGWLDWRGGPGTGVRIDPFVCSGHIYSANVGWISLGNGHPESGVAYQNDSASDFGVNLLPTGELRGLAYGANIGWLVFEAGGNPRLDLVSGRLSGQVYGANIGWISLADATFSLQIDRLAAGRDEDNDGIPDAWEFRYFPTLGVLGRNKDTDGDGLTDFDEYLADTDPTDRLDQLRITSLEWSAGARSATVAWSGLTTRRYKIQFLPGLADSAGWRDVGGEWLAPVADGHQRITVPLLPAPEGYFRILAGRPLAP